jgi:hypothetical protein
MQRIRLATDRIESILSLRDPGATFTDRFDIKESSKLENIFALCAMEFNRKEWRNFILTHKFCNLPDKRTSLSSCRKTQFPSDFGDTGSRPGYQFEVEEILKHRHGFRIVRWVV